MKNKAVVLLGICLAGLIWCTAWAQDADTSASETLAVQTPAEPETAAAPAADEPVLSSPAPAEPASAPAESVAPASVEPSAPAPATETPAPPEAAAPVPETPAVPAPAPAPASVPVVPVAPEAVAPAPAPAEPVVPAPVVAPKEPVVPMAPMAAKLPMPKIAPQVVVGITLIMLAVLIAAYVYCSLCLQIIAGKTNQSPAWWAWVPIANLFLMCKIAALRYWWVLGFFLAFVPFVGWLFVGVWNGYVWYKIAVARNKPGWVGILAVIPVVNLVIMGYLAFSDAPQVPTPPLENTRP